RGGGNGARARRRRPARDPSGRALRRLQRPGPRPPGVLAPDSGHRPDPRPRPRGDAGPRALGSGAEAARRRPALRPCAGRGGGRTRLIALSHVAWTTGAVLPIRELSGRGIPVLVDGAQGAGAIPVDVQELGCDFYTVSAQKWLLGPEGTGALYVRPERVGELR